MCIKHMVNGWDQLGSSELKEEMFCVSHRATAIKCAKEQLRMASPAEREMREVLMRIGGDDPDERSEHGVPRQLDLTQQQPPPPVSAAKTTVTITVSAAIAKTATKKGAKATAVSSRTRTTGEARCARTGTSTSATGVLDRIRNHSSHHDKSNEFECKMIHQQLMMDGENDLVLLHRVRERWRLIKCQSLICSLFQKMMI